MAITDKQLLQRILAAARQQVGAVPASAQNRPINLTVVVSSGAGGTGGGADRVATEQARRSQTDERRRGDPYLSAQLAQAGYYSSLSPRNIIMERLNAIKAAQFGRIGGYAQQLAGELRSGNRASLSSTLGMALDTATQFAQTGAMVAKALPVVSGAATSAVSRVIGNIIGNDSIPLVVREALSGIQGALDGAMAAVNKKIEDIGNTVAKFTAEVAAILPGVKGAADTAFARLQIQGDKFDIGDFGALVGRYQSAEAFKTRLQAKMSQQVAKKAVDDLTKAGFDFLEKRLGTDALQAAGGDLSKLFSQGLQQGQALAQAPIPRAGMGKLALSWEDQLRKFGASIFNKAKNYIPPK